MRCRSDCLYVGPHRFWSAGFLFVKRFAAGDFGIPTRPYEERTRQFTDTRFDVVGTQSFGIQFIATGIIAVELPVSKSIFGSICATISNLCYSFARNQNSALKLALVSSGVGLTLLLLALMSLVSTYAQTAVHSQQIIENADFIVILRMMLPELT